jgi:tetratricopeptide (TPR) repeat protein
MKNYILLYITLISIVSLNSYSQKKTVTTVKKNATVTNIDAIKTYERVAEKGYKSIEIFKKLGDAYYFNKDLDKAEKWYDKLFAMTTDLEPEYYYRYSQSLRAIGQIEKADTMLEKFNQLSDLKTR